jgi:dienelactone hydrolase
MNGYSGATIGESILIASKWNAYHATPAPHKEHKGAAILFLPDVIGIWQNSKLLADQFAANGYHYLIIDILNGDTVPLNRPLGYDMKKWMAEGSDGKNPHTPSAVDPIVEAGIAFLRKEFGAMKLGAVGYCFGGKVRVVTGSIAFEWNLLADSSKYVVRHYKSGIDVGYIAHPSNMLEDELSSISGPLSIAAAERDPIFAPEKRHHSEEILSKTGLPYELSLYSGVEHGFAVRCDLRVKSQKYAKEQAFLRAVAWFDEHLL